MKKLLVVCCLFSSHAFSQSADFLILKKNGKTLQSFYAGSNIAFVTNTGAYIDASINEIKNDTLYLQEFIIQQMLTKMGFYVTDTLGSYHYQFHYNQIRGFGHNKKKRGFDLAASGYSLVGGGLLLTLGSLVVLIADHKKFSPGLMIAGISAAGLGYLLSRTGQKPIILGKKYKLVYMNMKNIKTN